MIPTLSAAATTTANAATPDVASVTAPPPPPPPPPPGGGEGECRLLGPFSIVVQFLLGALAVSVLIYKRRHEHPPRPWKVWAFDVSKQVFGSGLMHLANLMASFGPEPGPPGTGPPGPPGSGTGTGTGIGSEAGSRLGESVTSTVTATATMAMVTAAVGSGGNGNRGVFDGYGRDDRAGLGLGARLGHAVATHGPNVGGGVESRGIRKAGEAVVRVMSRRMLANILIGDPSGALAAATAAARGGGGGGGGGVEVATETPPPPNPCSYYLLNLGLDTTIGVPFLYIILRVLNYLAQFTPLARPPESIVSGNYANPPRTWWWFKQLLIYFAGLVIMKSSVVVFISCFPGVVDFGNWALRWTEGNAAVQIIFVMLLFPLFMNALQYYVIDTFIKKKESGSDGVAGDDQDVGGRGRDRDRRDGNDDGDDDDDGAHYASPSVRSYHRVNRDDEDSRDEGEERGHLLAHHNHNRSHDDDDDNEDNEENHHDGNDDNDEIPRQKYPALDTDYKHLSSSGEDEDHDEHDENDDHNHDHDHRHQHQQSKPLLSSEVQASTNPPPPLPRPAPLNAGDSQQSSAISLASLHK